MLWHLEPAQNNILGSRGSAELLQSASGKAKHLHPDMPDGCRIWKGGTARSVALAKKIFVERVWGRSMIDCPARGSFVAKRGLQAVVTQSRCSLPERQAATLADSESHLMLTTP